MWKLFYYIDAKGKNAFKEWMSGLDVQLRAKLDMKLDMLMKYGSDLPPQLLSDTSSPHIKKIRINGRVALRPMLCRGPIDMKNEFTLLLGATEKDRKLIPSNADKLAEAIRQKIIADPTRRQQREEVV